ncbi:TMV resistance protein N [Capsicum annuum]|uniref:TMV resistance protein N n=1 Tax=Capsicum annuum TaxID=4072 RepID=UPI001FB11EC7|nr:TMV resistance protein N [Capsicum annuum]
MDSQIPTVKKWKYDVFLNFRRQDLEGNFVTQLYKRLEDMGINVFKPEFEYERKEEPITTEISEAIEESMIAITIFSEYYASSRQRLEELSKIMEWVDNQGQEFFLVFYRVTASQVSGIIDQTLAQYIADDIIFSYTVELQRWTDAFSKAFNIAGFKRDSFPLELIRCQWFAETNLDIPTVSFFVL